MAQLRTVSRSVAQQIYFCLVGSAAIWTHRAQTVRTSSPHHISCKATGTESSFEFVLTQKKGLRSQCEDFCHSAPFDTWAWQVPVEVLTTSQTCPQPVEVTLLSARHLTACVEVDPYVIGLCMRGCCEGSRYCAAGNPSIYM
eukprot:4261350-Amphidinium_carterae.1